MPFVPASLAPPLGCLFCPLYPPPVASSKDIWDIPLLKEEEEREEGKEDKEDNNNNTLLAGLGIL